MTETSHSEAIELDRLRAQRADLWHNLVALEGALAAPMPGRVKAWAASVHDALVDLSATFTRHIALTEGQGGLFEAILDSAPRLQNAIQDLRTEHEQVNTTLDGELRHLRDVTDATGDNAAEIRQRLTALVNQLSRHRQAGSDLVYEAYAVDIGVGD